MPRRKPTAMKKLSGTLRKHRTNPNEPTYPELGAEPPAFLDQAGRDEWSRLFPMLTDRGLLTAGDAAAFSGYCGQYSIWTAAMEAVKREGLVITLPNGVLAQNPNLAIATKASKEMRAFLVEFGLTPASRSRVEASARKDLSHNPFADVDPFAEFKR